MLTARVVFDEVAATMRRLQLFDGTKGNDFAD